MQGTKLIIDCFGRIYSYVNVGWPGTSILSESDLFLDEGNRISP